MALAPCPLFRPSHATDPVRGWGFSGMLADRAGFAWLAGKGWSSMREPPADLADETLRASLGARYGLAVTDLMFLPLGHDASAWVYRAGTADGAAYFLKVRRRVTNPPSLLVPRYLHDQGITRVIAPLPTTTQTFLV